MEVKKVNDNMIEIHDGDNTYKLSIEKLMPKPKPVRGKLDTPEFLDGLETPSGYRQIVKTFGKPGNVKLAKVKVPAVLEKHPYLKRGYFYAHELLKERLEWVFQTIVDRGLDHLLFSYDGCYNPRPKRGSKSFSTHAWGIALDVNYATNRMGQKPKLDKRIVEIFEAAGFFWGGNWKRPDGMHFQFATGY